MKKRVYKKRKESICKRCGKKKQREEKGLRKNTGYLREKCKDCLYETSKEFNEKEYIYRKFKKTECEMCGFKGHPCQLDVNHKDMNHKNNELKNLETLCANCHRLVTFVIQREVKIIK